MGHEMGCRYLTRNHTDAAKAVSDTYNLHCAADRNNAIGKWFAAALQDGKSDGVLYDSKRDCVIHQHHNEMYYAYVQIRPSSMSVCEAETFLEVNRRLYSAGIRMTDPADKHGGRDLIQRASIEDMRSLIRSVETGRPANNTDYRGVVK